MRPKDLGGIQCCLQKRGKTPRDLCQGREAHRWPKLPVETDVGDPCEVFPGWERVAHQLKRQERRPRWISPHPGFGQFRRPTQQVVLSCLLV